jgi:hypothetical protein
MVTMMPTWTASRPASSIVSCANNAANDAKPHQSPVPRLLLPPTDSGERFGMRKSYAAIAGFGFPPPSSFNNQPASEG